MYIKHKKIYDNLTINELDTPEAILDPKNAESIYFLTGDAIFPRRKQERLFKFAEWWPKSQLSELLLEDIANSRKKEFTLRDEFAKKAPGFGNKCASLFMTLCGYENVAVLDLWALRFMGYEAEGGLRQMDYLEKEEKFQEKAQSMDLTPAQLHRLIWCKNSTWKKVRRKSI